MAASRLTLPSRRALLCAGGGVLASAAFGSVARAREVIARNDLASVFQEMSVAGTFAAFDANGNRLIVVDPERAARRYIPASTFKIPNTLIAVETGAVTAPDELFRYDGKPRAVKAWEKDMTLREAITVSNVPVYQEVARRVGLQRYATWMDRLDYGNREVGATVDEFWLKGPLQISAIEQAQFLGALAKGQLKASHQAQAIARDMIRIEAKGSRVLFAKTGWTGKIGWWVGWVEDGARATAFALNIDMPSVDMAPQRIALGKELMARLDVY